MFNLMEIKLSLKDEKAVFMSDKDLDELVAEIEEALVPTLDHYKNNFGVEYEL